MKCGIIVYLNDQGNPAESTLEPSEGGLVERLPTPAERKALANFVYYNSIINGILELMNGEDEEENSQLGQ